MGNVTATSGCHACGDVLAASKVRISYTARTTRLRPRLSVRYAKSAQSPDSPERTGTVSPAG